MFEVKTDYLEHTTGTKFYETVLIKHHSGKAMLLKRYGPIAKKVDGGKVLIETGNFRVVLNEQEKILYEKRKLRSGSRYVDVSSKGGLHSLSDGGTVVAADVINRLDHYGDRKVREEISGYFSLLLEDVDDIVAATGQDAGVEEIEPEPEPDRGNSWASW